MTSKQRRFIEEYLINGGNASLAAKSAGYGECSCRQIGSRLLTNCEIRAEIDARLKALDEQSVAKANEVLKFLSRVLRSEETEETVTVSGKLVTKKASVSDRLKAAAILAKYYGLDKEQKTDAPLRIEVVPYSAVMNKVDKS